MAVARFLQPDAFARAAATPVLRLVQDATLRAWHRPRELSGRRPWRGTVLSIAIHAALIAAFLWQTTGEHHSAAAIDVVFQQVATASAEARSGAAPTKIEEATTAAQPDVAEAESVAPVDAVAPEPPVEPVATVSDAPDVPPPEPVAQLAADMPVDPVPPLSRPVARQRPVEAPRRVEPKPAPSVAATAAVREAAPATPPEAPGPSASAAAAAPVSVAAVPAAAASTSRSQGDIPVVHDARFRQPPTPAHYPPRAVDLGQQGIVIVRALVGPDGTADEIVVWRSSGYALLDTAALRAVRGWLFEPASVSGRRITAWVEVPVRFAIR